MNMSNSLESDSFRPIPFYFITTTDPVALSEEEVSKSMKQLKDAEKGQSRVLTPFRKLSHARHGKTTDPRFALAAILSCFAQRYK